MLKCYQWRPWLNRRDTPEVLYDMDGAYVMDGPTRLPINPMQWVVVEDDGHVDVKPPSWRPADSRTQGDK